METFLLEELRRIANSAASELTKDDKTFILEQCAEHGVTIKGRRCLSCYVDAAVELYRILTAGRSHNCGDKKAIRYRLKDGVDVRYNGERVNADTMTDERAEALLRRGFPIAFFNVVHVDED